MKFDDNEIAKTFENLTMEDFLVDTTALHEMRLNDWQLEHLDGVENWEDWTRGMVAVAKTTYLSMEAQNDQFVAMSILTSRTNQRLYLPYEDETIRDFRGRIQREAKEMSACWGFAAIVTPHAMYDDEPLDIHMGDSEAIRQGLEDGTLGLGIFWVSERSNDGDRNQNSGVIEFDENMVPGNVVEADVEERFNPFSGMVP